MTYSHMANATLPSAHYGFTSEFGKGSGGSHVLWSPDKLVERCFSFVFSFGVARIRLSYQVIKLSLSVSLNR
jgi:hypothetical protein